MEIAERIWNIDLFFEVSLEILGIAGPDGYFKRVNPAFARTLGYTIEELLAKPYLEFIHPDDVPATLNEIEQLANGQPTPSFENRYRHKDGTHRWLSWTVFPLERVLYAAGRDVTEQKAAALSALAHLSDLLEQAPAAIAVLHGANHVYTLANPRYQKLFSRTKAELIGRSIKEVFSEVEEQEIFNLLRTVFTTGEAYTAIEFPVTIDHSGNGTLETGYYNFVLQPIKDQSSHVTDILGHVYEVTEQVVARQKVDSSEERFKAIVNQSMVGIAQTDLTGRYVFVNDRYCEIVGDDREALLQKRMQDITYAEDLPHNLVMFERMVTTGESFILEKRYVRQDGLLVWVNNTVSLVRDVLGKPQYVLAITIDMTEQKRSEQTMIEQERKLAVVEERQRFARELHDAVSQTLFSATTIAQSLPGIWRINQERAFTLLEDMVILNRAAMAEMRTLLLELRPEAIIRTSLPELFEQLLFAARGHKALQTKLVVEGSKPFLEPDVHVACYRIVQEAINNVLKHSKAENLIIYYSSYPDKVVVRVDDDGRGFNMAQIAAGMGLNNMRERAEAVGATVELASSVGDGTTLILQKRLTPS